MTMKKLLTVCLMLSIAAASMAQNMPKGIFFGEKQLTSSNAKDIFGDGHASYDAQKHTLVLQEGCQYRLGKGFVTINTGSPLLIILKGNANISASIISADPIVLQSEGEHTLNINSNISGSTLKCPAITVEHSASLYLLSRNSQKGHAALDCAGDVTVNGGSLRMEVTTADYAAVMKQLVLNGSVIQRPKGGKVAEDGIYCMGDGIPAKIIRIVPE